MYKLMNAIWGLLVIGCLAGCGPSPEEGEWWVRGVYEARISLNGEWKFTMAPPPDFWSPARSTKEWADIAVPGECSMQGFAIQHDRPFVYRRRFSVPADFKDKKIILQFDGVYSHAKVWVNGQFIREHFGGFTPWDCDITAAVKPGEEAVLALEVVDPRDDISYASGYAKHPIGGILRDVWLKAFPVNHLAALHIVTDLDTSYRDALLQIEARGILTAIDSLAVHLELVDPDGKPVPLQPSVLNLKKEDRREETTGKISIPVLQPLLWDAEHPHLYTLRVTLVEKGQKTFAQTYRIGFREIERRGRLLLVNGREVKLRGACRHDMHPLLGRMTTPEQDRQDVLLAKEANLNFIRTSHYPPSEAFLRYCDEYGIYVEEEAAVCFVDSWRMPEYKPHSSQNDPAYASRYLGQLAEMVEAHRNHPAVIIWSLGNESFYGENFRQSFRYVRRADPSRPVMFSYPGTVPRRERPYDIISLHYPEFTGDKEEFGIRVSGFTHPSYPVLHDEYAHVACYDRDELREDPNVRNFWGRSLDTMWTRIFETDGALGGAIWGMVDETFMIPAQNSGFRDWWGFDNIWDYPGPTVGYGEWGIVDVWRRKKPEFWHVKKAYSPTKILQTSVDSFEAGQPLRLPVYNRFNHTNFSELQVRWVYGRKAGKFRGPDIPPRQRDTLEIPAQRWRPGTVVEITFFDASDQMIDTYEISFQGEEQPLQDKNENDAAFLLEETDSTAFSFANGTFSVHFRSSDGLLSALIADGDTLLGEGPFLQYRVRDWKSQGQGVFPLVDLAGDWRLDSLRKEIDTLGLAQIWLFGRCDTLRLEYHLTIAPGGLLTTNYRLHNPSSREVKDLGIYYRLPSGYRRLEWERDGYWTSYPAGHFDALSGEVDLDRPLRIPAYRKEPRNEWVMDYHSFFYDGLPKNRPQRQLPYLARGSKEGVRRYALLQGNGKGVEVLAPANLSCRLFYDAAGRLILNANHLLDYVSLSWGNYMRRQRLSGPFEGKVVLRVNE